MKMMKLLFYMEVVRVEQRNTRLVLRNDSSDNWITENAILLKGEMGLEFLEDKSVKIKIGDGQTKWKDLPYFGDIKEIIARLEKLEQGLQSNTAPLFDEVLILNCGGAKV